MSIKIPVYKPSLNGNEKQYVMDCLDSTWISSKGKYIERFEKEFANYIGVKYAASVSNGTVAIHVALLALGIGKGDEVIVPTFTYIASVNAIYYAGATPVFVDSLHETWQMDPADVQRKITNKTKAILAVHLYGHSCDMNELMKICEQNKLYLIEDCAESIGTSFNNQLTGTFGHISTFSFFGNKTITTGEGGMVVTNDKHLYEESVHIKGQGLAKDREYFHDIIGYNYRMTNICAAIGLAQLENVNFNIQKKQQVARWYFQELAGLPLQFHQQQQGTFHTYWMCSVLVEQASLRDPLRYFMKKNGIETRPLFFPVHTMPMYLDNSNMFPVADDISLRGINLPSFPDLTYDEIVFIKKSITDFFNEHKH